MSHKELLEELRQPVKDLREHIPAVFEGYGALDAKTKELIVRANAVTKQRFGCMASHARGAARRGATVEEVTILMNGGPGTVHAPRAFEAFHEFARK